MTSKQKEALALLVNGPALVPCVTFVALRDKGLVTGAPEVAKTRGYTGAAITAEGRKAVKNG